MGNKQIQSEITKNLDGVLRWRQREEERFEKEELKLQRDGKLLQDEIERLREELKKVEERQVEAKSERAALDGQELEKKRTLLFDGLKSENGLIEERNSEYQKIQKEHESNLNNMLSIPEYAQKIKEYESFLDIQETLAQLPESYRNATMTHHGVVRKALDPVFTAMNAPLPKSSLAPAALTVQIFSETSIEELREVAILLPIRFEVFTRWREGEETLEHKILFRINGAIAAMLKKVGVVRASIREEDFDGYILLLVSIYSELLGDLKVALQAEIARINRYATELQVSQMSLNCIWLSSDIIESDEEEYYDEY